MDPAASMPEDWRRLYVKAQATRRRERLRRVTVLASRILLAALIATVAYLDQSGILDRLAGGR